eukprot:TRINITY_DN4031_c0_g1_i2.p1 TRINITY_DN4031_c0_g1~~TRINITY_DN4031_c0_g1_i2.p1  ORF type:complete len:384 (-),score=48.94 TRINITY_DN4031_c0_g1_i2:204-1355(-)
MLFMIVAGLVTTVQLILGKAMKSLGWPYHAIVSMSYAMAFGIFALVAGICKAPFPERRDVIWILLRGLSANGTLACMIAAVRLGAPTGDVAALGGVNTVFAALLGRIFLGEPLQLSHIISVLCCITGGVVISKPAFLFGMQSNSVPILAHLMAVLAGFCSAVISVSARKAGNTSPWFLNMCGAFTGCVVFIALPLTPFVDEPHISVLMDSVYLAGICIVGSGIMFVIGIGATTGGSMLCPAAVSATVNVSSRLTLGYLADVLIMGGTVDPVSLCGAALMLGAVVVMACARKPAGAASSPRVAEAPEEFSELPSSSAAAEEDETSSLASFIASEFVAERGHQGGMYQRRRVASVAGDSAVTPTHIPDRTLFGVAATCPPASRVR